MTSWCVESLPMHAAIRWRLPVDRRALLNRILRCFLALTAWQAGAAHGHVPVPNSVLNPQSAPEAWNVLRLAVGNIERLAREDRLTEVPDQASLCSPALRELARLEAASTNQKEVAMRTVQAATTLDSLVQMCMAGDRTSVGPALTKLHAALDALAVGMDPRIVNADIFLCPMHPEVVSVDGLALCPKCGMALIPRRIPYSFVYVAPPGEPSMRLTAECDAPPTAGRPTFVKVRLTMRDGSPVRGNRPADRAHPAHPSAHH